MAKSKLGKRGKSVNIDLVEWEALVAYAEERGMLIRAVVTFALREYIERHPEKAA